MPVNRERLQRLTRFGLTEAQARAYLALLDLGDAPAKDVAALARVPKAKVYGALEALVNAGLAEARPGHPRRYAPLPLDAHVRQLAREARRRADALDAEAGEVARAFPVTGRVDVAPRAGFAALRGRRSVHQRVLDVLADARERVTLRASPGFLERVARGDVGDALRDARVADVRVLVVTPPRDADARVPAAAARVDAWADVREAPVVGHGDVTVIVVDGRVAVIARSVPDDASPRAGDDVALVTRDAAFARAFEDLAIAFLPSPEQLFYRERA